MDEELIHLKKELIKASKSYSSIFKFFPLIIFLVFGLIFSSWFILLFKLGFVYNLVILFLFVLSLTPFLFFLHGKDVEYKKVFDKFVKRINLVYNNPEFVSSQTINVKTSLNKEQVLFFLKKLFEELNFSNIKIGENEVIAKQKQLNRLIQVIKIKLIGLNNGVASLDLSVVNGLKPINFFVLKELIEKLHEIN